jgi:hypothetical protein
MRIRYTLADQPHELEIADSEDLAEMCAEAERQIRGDHPELANQNFLTERVADALLNTLASGRQEAELGELP